MLTVVLAFSRNISIKMLFQTKKKKKVSHFPFPSFRSDVKKRPLKKRRQGWSSAKSSRETVQEEGQSKSLKRKE